MNGKELQQIFVRANEFKEGDLQVGGTRDELERSEARAELSSLRVGDITRTALVEDDLSVALSRSLDARVAGDGTGDGVGERVGA